jgi:hypothetical protein
MGLVFDGVEGQGTFQPRDNLVLGNAELALHGGSPPPLKSIHGSARPKRGYPNMEE